MYLLEILLEMASPGLAATAEMHTPAIIKLGRPMVVMVDLAEVVTQAVEAPFSIMKGNPAFSTIFFRIIALESEWGVLVAMGATLGPPI